MNQPAPRKMYKDSLSVSFTDADAKWVTDSLAKDRRICLYGIGVALSQSGRKSCHFDPVIPAIGKLCELIRSNPMVSEFSFDKNTRAWKVVTYD